jgi:predicted NBD/HSP70 family sugar kinase
VSGAHDGLTQAEIGRQTGLSAASVTNLVRQLATSGEVAVTWELRAGRRSRVVTPTPAHRFVIGLDLGRTHIRGGVATLDHRLLAQQYRPMETEPSVSDTLAKCADLMAVLLHQASLTRTDIAAMVVGVPGPLDSASGEIGAGAVLPELSGIHLERRFSEALDFPVVVENDANLGALGEFTWATAAGPAAPQVYVRLSTGIGCGIVIDGSRLWRGASGTAGELGHISLDPSGRLCRCGNRGCLETTASTPALLENLSEAMERPVTLPEWLAMATRGQSASVRLLEEMGRHVGAAIASLVNLINPAVVVIGGPVTASGDLLLAPVKQAIIQRSMPSPGAVVKVRLPRHPDLSELHGALALAATHAPPGFNT